MAARGSSGGFSLGFRIFLLTGLLLAVVVGGAVVVVHQRGKAAATEQAEAALARSVAAERNWKRRGLDQLARASATFTDSAVAASLLEAATTADVTALGDALSQRQGQLGYDFAIVLDAFGRVIVRTDDRGAGGDDMARRPLVAQAIAADRGTAAGYWHEEGALYNTVVVPLEESFERRGFVVVGFKIDDVVARDLQQASGAEVVFLVYEEGGAAVAGSTLGGSGSDLITELRRSGNLRVGAEAGRGAGGDESHRFSLDLNGRLWEARLSPLRDVAGTAVGAILALASPQEALFPYQRIRRLLLLAGGIGLLLALALGSLLGAGTLGPVGRLAAAAEAARQGYYDQGLPVGRSGVVGRLARAMSHLFSDLRQRQESEAYLARLWRNLPEGGKGAAVEAPRVRQVTLVSVELRRYVRSSVIEDPERAVDRLARDLRQAAAAVTARHGRMEAVLGHRLLASFEGEGKSLRGLAAATEILAAVAAPEDAFDEPADPLVVLAGGKAVAGTAVWGEAPETTLVGMPVQKMESLLREAVPGDLVLSREVFRELEDALKAAGIELTAQRGVVSPLPLYVLGREAAAQLTAVDLSAAVAPGVLAQRRTAAGELAPGKLLGYRFEILGQLGAGSLGTVYRTRDRELGDLVALRALRSELWEDPVDLDRLHDRLRVARKIQHPNVVRLYDYGELDGVHYAAMEYVRGVSLRTVLDQTQRLPFPVGLQVAKQACAALAAGHAQGVLHGSLKAANVVLDQTGRARLMDFGVARAGSVPAPEQVQGEDGDARSDLFALGALLYEVFTGRPPFAEGNVQQAPRPPREHWPEIPEALERAILRCLATRPAERFGTAAGLLAELEAQTA